MSEKTLLDHGPGDIDAEANKILQEELKEKWPDNHTYEALRQNPLCHGFHSSYLSWSANFEKFSTSAETSKLLKLAKLDLQKGSTIPQLVFSCCQFFAEKVAVESLIDLGKETETEEKVIESVFQFQDHEGTNCLIGLFKMAAMYWHENSGKYPSGPFLADIEESCSFLITLARSAKLDLNKILNHTNKFGATLFLFASSFSEEIMKQLLAENVQVHSITVEFVMSNFRVR